jgi:23S rRNA (cytosine1962-C5)-methyltransferase
MDPPSFGRGAKGETWKIEEKLIPLLSSCKKVLSKDPLFFLVNGSASGYSSIAYKNNLESIFADSGGRIESGEIAIEESKSGRLLPAGIFARWSC